MADFGTIVKIILLLMKMADSLFAWVHEQQWIREGEDRAVARAALALAARSKRAREIEAEYSKMPFDKVREELEKQGDFRD